MNLFSGKIHSNQEMVDNGNKCTRNQIFKVGIGLDKVTKLFVRSFGLAEYGVGRIPF